jgi:hypothetical protein
VAFAARELWNSWAEMAASPANAMPTVRLAAPHATAPSAGSLTPMSVTVSAAPRTTFAMSASSSAAASGACRPTRPAPISSARPVSSFCRVCRIIANVLMSAASTSPEESCGS